MRKNSEVPRARISPEASDNSAADAPGIAARRVNIVESTSANETWIATSGTDLFVFDASTFQGDDTIIGFDPSEDRVQIVSAWDFSYEPIEGVIEHFGLSEHGTYRAYSGSVTLNIGYAYLESHDSISIFYPNMSDAFFVI